MDSSSKQYDRMMTVPVERLIPSLAVPTVLSMMTSALYNTADTWFVSHLGDAATAAVGVSFPLVAVIQALGFWIGMGAASNISRFLGRKSVFKANIVAMSAVVLSLLSVPLGTAIKDADATVRQRHACVRTLKLSCVFASIV